MSEIDFGRHSRDYAEHRPGFPDSFYARLAAHIAIDGARALDLATGPGVVALQLARRGAHVTGIDIADGQIRSAIEQADAMGLADRATFEVSRAETFEAPESSLDLVTAGQCWRWFDHDMLLKRLLRMLKPGGRLVIAHFDYLAPRCEIARRTEQLILAHNPGWTLAGKDGLYPHYIDQVLDAGYEFDEQFCYDHDQPFTHETWRGRIRTCNGVGSGGMTEPQVEVFDGELAELLRREHPNEPLYVRHRVWAVIASRPGTTS